MDYDYLSNQLKIFGNNGAVEYTEFSSTVMTWTKSYYYLGERLLSTVTPNGSGGEITEYNHPDRLGTRLVTNQAAGTNYEQINLPFGTALNAESTGSNSKRFTSYERSARTGLDYAVNRTYDSKQGRFTQIDPIGMEAASLEIPQTLNLYNYCGNDPINYTDPDGLFWGAIGRFFNRLGKFLDAVTRVVSKVLNNRWVRIGFFVLDFILPGLGGVIGQIAKWSLAIYNKASDIVGLMQLTGMVLQGKFKEIGISLAMAAAMAPLTALTAGIKNGMQNALFKNHHGGYADVLSILKTAWSGFKEGFKAGWKQLKDGFSRRGLKALIPFYGNWCGPGYGENNDPNMPGINEFDNSGCKPHDGDMITSKDPNKFIGKPGARLWFRIKADFRLIGRSIIYGTNVHAVDIVFGGKTGLGANYKFMLIPSFLFGRIIPMSGQLAGHQALTVIRGGH